LFQAIFRSTIHASSCGVPVTFQNELTRRGHARARDQQHGNGGLAPNGLEHPSAEQTLEGTAGITRHDDHISLMIVCGGQGLCHRVTAADVDGDADDVRRESRGEME
jgi:hypothetical protein